MIFGTGIDVAIGVFLALTFAEYIGLSKRAEKAFRWIGAGAVALVLAGVFQATPFISEWVSIGSNNYGYAAFGILGWVLILIGTIWVLFQLLTE